MLVICITNTIYYFCREFPDIEFTFTCSIHRFIKKSDSTPEWHSNESGAYRANIYIETSNYNSVDLMFTTDEISIKKLLIIDTDKNNVIIWDDRKIQHRTPKNILDENFPRSFIYISLIPTHNYNYNNRNKPFNKFKSNKTVNESYVQ